MAGPPWPRGTGRQISMGVLPHGATLAAWVQAMLEREGKG